MQNATGSITKKKRRFALLGPALLLAALGLGLPASADRLHSAMFMAEMAAADARYFDSIGRGERVAPAKKALPLSHWRPFYLREGFNGRIDERFDDMTRDAREREAKVVKAIVSIDEI